MLLTNSVHDPATPYTWALGALSQLGSHGRLVTYEGTGHTMYQRTPCTRAYVDRYLINLTVPAKGATCPPA